MHITDSVQLLPAQYGVRSSTCVLAVLQPATLNVASFNWPAQDEPATTHRSIAYYTQADLGFLQRGLTV